MYVVVESPVDAIRADFRRIHRSSMLQRAWHAVARCQERLLDRATARGVARIDHTGVAEDYSAARRPR